MFLSVKYVHSYEGGGTYLRTCARYFYVRTVRVRVYIRTHARTQILLCMYMYVHMFVMYERTYVRVCQSDLERDDVLYQEDS